MIASSTPIRPHVRQPAISYWRWPVIIAVLLVGHMTLMMWAVTRATTNNTATIIPDYYAKSLKWDDTKAAAQVSASLGWKSRLDLSGEADEFGHRLVRVLLTDAGGGAIAAPAVRLTYYHDGHAADVQTAELKAAGPGLFEARVQMRWHGFHHFTIVATAEGHEFVQEWVQFIGR